MSISRLSLCILFLIAQANGQAQDLQKTVNKLVWVKEKIGRGMQFQQIHTSRLFDSKQFISVIKCNRNRALSIGFSHKDLKLTSQFASESDALAAVNAGFFNMKEGGSVTFLKVDDVVINKNSDANERITKSCLAINEKGRLNIPVRVDPEWYEDPDNYDDVLFTGPLLMRDGSLDIKNEDPKDVRHPRTCVCVRKNDDVLLITVDGRNKEAQGMTLLELARLTKALKCRNAINLDGGGSTTMWIARKGVVNHPSDNKFVDAQGERKVANVLLVH